MIDFDDEPLTGIWTVSSKTDQRWNNSEEATVTGTTLPNELEAWIKDCTKKFGSPPADLDKGFWPDVC